MIINNDKVFEMIIAGDLVIEADVTVLKIIFPDINEKDFIYDRYFIALCECNTCKQHQLRAWPALRDNEILRLDCEACGMIGIFPVKWIKEKKQ